MDALKALYHRVSPGGLIYIDDYGSYAGAARGEKEGAWPDGGGWRAAVGSPLTHLPAVCMPLSHAGCQRAVNEFRAAHGVKAPLQLQAMPETGFQSSGNDSIWEAAWWIKERSVRVRSVEGRAGGCCSNAGGGCRLHTARTAALPLFRTWCLCPLQA